MNTTPNDKQALDTQCQRQAPPPRLALRPHEVAAALGLGRRKLHELTKAGVIPHAKLGACVLYPLPALQAWLDKAVKGQDNDDQ